MSLAKRVVVAALTAAAVLSLTSRVALAQQTTLSAARELYAAAAYDEALNALNALSAGGDAAADSGTVALYRALCLYALGRTGEGDRAVETLVAQNPSYHPPLDELSPRMRATVIETRRRVLPDMLQQKYAEAKTAFENQDFASASDGFRKVIEGLADPDIADAASRSPLADLATLASGFRDLAEKALAPPPPAPEPVAAAPAVVAPAAPRIYSAEDDGVVAPVPLRQAVPAYTRTVTVRRTAVVELLINEKGAVESAAMLSPLDPQYDKAVVAAAKNWQYEPAKNKDGKAVKYQKRVQISLVPDTAR